MVESFFGRKCVIIDDSSSIYELFVSDGVYWGDVKVYGKVNVVGFW